jgi:hypothetical protein
MAQLIPPPFKCRFETASAEGTLPVLQGEFCIFDFPGCRDCRFSLHSIKTVQASEDPMKSLVWRNLSRPEAAVDGLEITRKRKSHGFNALSSRIVVLQSE